MLRSRAKNVSKTVKNLDAFPKVPESYVETSPVGGTFSVVTCCLIVWLLYAEISYYLDANFKFRFVPDTDFDAKLKINVDLTVAMPCHAIGADILDSTGQNVLQFGSLEQEDTWFELSPQQRRHFDGMRQVNSYLREEFHAIQELLWRSGQSTLFGDMPKRTVNPSTPPDACRIFGSLVLNKVAGNFHITAGHSLALPRGHIHISAFMSESDYNFTHRINRFSFGDPSPGIIHPLEGDEKITDQNTMLYQYFVDVVPTEVNTFLSRLDTYQYSVKDHERPIDHHKGSHGIPGIFFKYDMSALKVQVTQERDSPIQFIVRLCAVIAGIYVTSGLINSFVQIVVNILKCKYIKKPIQNVVAEKVQIPPGQPTHVPVSLLQNDEPTTNIQTLDLTTGSVQKSPDIITSHYVLHT
ncbi:endoplasmic reticulum-Golgi intermediate compartment protein 2 [Periplaneta americana]|uniref:endoplasmic reticulum-Golgi intermediate compartment protein 2 n=1 Tax=Periplaneta americana TaxID=6978 RepID=UPI0037E734B9